MKISEMATLREAANSKQLKKDVAKLLKASGLIILDKAAHQYARVQESIRGLSLQFFTASTAEEAALELTENGFAAKVDPRSKFYVIVQATVTKEGRFLNDEEIKLLRPLAHRFGKLQAKLKTKYEAAYRRGRQSILEQYRTEAVKALKSKGFDSASKFDVTPVFYLETRDIDEQ